jgi:hypothetical protein
VLLADIFFSQEDTRSNADYEGWYRRAFKVKRGQKIVETAQMLEQSRR